MPAQAKKVDITLVIKHVMNEANLDLPLDKSFLDTFTEKLLAISDFLHFVSRERIPLRRRRPRTG